MMNANIADEDFATFQYQALPGPDYIRVLIVYPSQHLHSPVVCDIEAVPLRRSSRYAALSYSWGLENGDASPNRWITVAGQYLRVTQNLYEALQRLRSTRRPQPIWVDAVCINQNDIPERNQQVSAMAKVYAYATQVVAWLGQGRHRAEDTAALAILKCLNEAPKLHYDCQHAWRTKDDEAVDFCEMVQSVWDFALRVRQGEEITDWLKDAGLTPQSQYDLNYRDRRLFRYRLSNIERILGAFLGRRYFGRRWIVQELFHPQQKAITVAWGPCLYPLADLLTSLDHAQRFLSICRSAWESLKLEHEHGDIDQQWVPFNRYPAIGWGMFTREPYQGPVPVYSSNLSVIEGLVCDAYNVVGMVEDRKNLTLHNALSRCSKLQCADPRDIVFALLSLGERSGLKADYRQSQGETFSTFGQYLVKRDLFELALHNLRGHERQDPFTEADLPSWVPDLRQGFVDKEITHAPLEASVDTMNVVTARLYLLGFLHRDSITSYAGVPIKNNANIAVGYTEGHTRVVLHRIQMQNESHDESHKIAAPLRALSKRLRRRSQRDQLQCWLPNHGVGSRAMQPGDMICATRKGWWDSEHAEILLLRPSADDWSVNKIVRVFSNQDFRPFGFSMPNYMQQELQKELVDLDNSQSGQIGEIVVRIA